MGANFCYLEAKKSVWQQIGRRWPQFRLYIAVSLDGFIATADGGVEWLDPFKTDAFGYDAFFDCEFCTEVSAFLPKRDVSTMGIDKTLKRNLSTLNPKWRRGK